MSGRNVTGTRACALASLGGSADTGLRAGVAIGGGGVADVLRRRFCSEVLAIARAICSWLALSCSAVLAFSRAEQLEQFPSPRICFSSLKPPVAVVVTLNDVTVDGPSAEAGGIVVLRDGTAGSGKDVVKNIRDCDRNRACAPPAGLARKSRHRI